MTVQDRTETGRSPGPEASHHTTRHAEVDPGDPALLADWLINRIFGISLELHITAMKDARCAALVDDVVENLDQLITDVRRETFAARQRSARPEPAPEIARAIEALHAALEHLGSAWTTAVTSDHENGLGDRLSQAAHLTRSATRTLSSEALY